jgi:hypothetical protein
LSLLFAKRQLSGLAEMRETFGFGRFQF